ncbi:hypothetical protein GCM10027359_07560 [Marilutibacter aestuarii]
MTVKAAGSVVQTLDATAPRWIPKPITNPQPPIPNPQSPIPNPQSPIPNPQSQITASSPLSQGAASPTGERGYGEDSLGPKVCRDKLWGLSGSLSQKGGGAGR